MQVAVIGHVEVIDFVRVDRVPDPGEIIHATESWSEPGGGGAIAAVQLAKLAGGATLYTALGDDEFGHRARRDLESLGLRVEATFRPVPQRRGFTFVDGTGERTITVFGERLGPHGEDPLPWGNLDDADGVFVTAGDPAAIRHGRRARTLAATSRILDVLAQAGAPIDALVGSARDPAERWVPGALDPPPGLVVMTAGGTGGSYRTADGVEGTFPPALLPGPMSDAYGAGDCFAGGLTFGLGAGLPVRAALEVAALCGAYCLTGRGPYQGQLTLQRLPPRLRPSGSP